MAQPSRPADPGLRSPFHIRAAQAVDETSFVEMSNALLAEANEPHEPGAVASAWRRSLDPASSLQCLVAVDEGGTPVGFMLYVTHDFSWTTRPVCYFLDLYVRPTARRHGIGRAFLAHLTETGRREGWSRIYWMTQEDNAKARQLYDQFGHRSPLIRYETVFPLG